MTEYTKDQIDEAVSGEKKNFSLLKRRIEKWDIILNEIHEDLKYLHEEFNSIYDAINKISQNDECP